MELDPQPSVQETYGLCNRAVGQPYHPTFRESHKSFVFRDLRVSAKRGNKTVIQNNSVPSRARIVVSLVHPRGFEPLTFGSVDRNHDDVSSNSANDLRPLNTLGCRYGCHQLSHQLSADGQPLESGSATNDADLTHLVTVWPQLPEHVRLAIHALVATVVPTHSQSGLHSASDMDGSEEGRP